MHGGASGFVYPNASEKVVWIGGQLYGVCAEINAGPFGFMPQACENLLLQRYRYIR